MEEEVSCYCEQVRGGLTEEDQRILTPGHRQCVTGSLEDEMV